MADEIDEDGRSIEFRHAQAIHSQSREELANVNHILAESGVAAVKLLLLMNGGAVVAMLAFIASAIGSIGAAGFDGVVSSLRLFSLGVACSGAAACGTYLTNFAYYAERAYKTHEWEHPYIRSNRRSGRWRVMGIALQIATILVAMAALVLFVVAVLWLSNSLEQLI